MKVHVQFDHRDGNAGLTYMDVRWDTLPRIGEIVHVADANRREYIVGGPFWVIDEIVWSLDLPTPRVRVIPERAYRALQSA